MSIGTTLEKRPERDVRTRRRAVAWIAAGAVVLAAGGVGVGLLLGGDAGPTPGAGSPSASASPLPSPVPSAGPTQSPSTPAFAFQPLWPFAGGPDAAAWQQAYRAGGHQPWHLDPAATAVAFSRNYLGYTDIDRDTSRTVSGSQAWVGVGTARPDGSTATAAVVHLARIGTGQDAPWEVVGTGDTDLSLTVPAYGSTVRSPLTVGGRITGVDESLVVQVRSQRDGLLARSPSVPAGGDRTPWSVQVGYAARAGTVLTISVSTGGHVAGVERFAVTGVRAGDDASLADGRHAVRLTRVDPAARHITVDVVQIFFGADADRAAREDHAAEVPPPNDVWIRNTSPALRTLPVAPDAPITVNVHGAAESGSATKDVARTLPELAAVDHLGEGVFWLTVRDGQVTRIAEQYLP